MLRQIDHGLGLTRALAECFHDRRDERFVEHTRPQLLAQRIYGRALGYEDLNDQEQLRRDPLLATACAKRDPRGQDRLNPQDRGMALAAPATLNRLELSNNKTTRGHKLPHDPAKVAACLLKLGGRCLPKHAKAVVIDLDRMGPLVHGLPEGRHFSAYHGGDCYRPLYIVVGEVGWWAQLRTSDRDGADGGVPALEKVGAALRQRGPKARLIVRGDSGFCRDEIMVWREAPREVYSCLGLAKNSVSLEKLTPAMAAARARHCLCGGANVRAFVEFRYRTQKSWRAERRVAGKAEVMAAGDNPRFLVPNLPPAGCKGEKDRERFSAARLEEELYGARGERENGLKPQVLDLHADAMSPHHLASNQLRLWLAAFAYLLGERRRALGCHGTEPARATAGTLRLKLLKVAAQVTVSVRRVYLQLSSAYPGQDLFRLWHARLLRLVSADG